MQRTSRTSVVSLLLLASARTADAYIVGSRPASLRAPPVLLSATTPVPPPDVAPPPAASTTTPSSIPVPPPDLPASLETCSQPLKPGQAIRGLYRAFNSRDAEAAASYLTEDCVYEDLLLGPYTVCRGRQAFCDALKFHPAFVSAQFFSELPFASLLPDLTLEVDSVAEGVDTVGVEWHVQLGDQPFPLGRGLSQASVDPATGKIVSSAPRPARLRARPNCAYARSRDRPRPTASRAQSRVVDIAEAPWRVIGTLLVPALAFAEVATGWLKTNVDGERGTGPASAAAAELEAEELLRAREDAKDADRRIRESMGGPG